MAMRKNKNSIKHFSTTGKSGTLKARKAEYFKLLRRIGFSVSVSNEISNDIK